MAVWTLLWARLKSVPSSKTSPLSFWNAGPAPTKKPSRRSFALAADGGSHEGDCPASLRSQRLGRSARDLARLAIDRTDVGPPRVLLTVRVDGDHDLARFLEISHLIGDAGRLGFEDGDRHALDVGQTEYVLEEPDLTGGLPLRYCGASRPGPRTPWLRRSSPFRQPSTSRSCHS